MSFQFKENNLYYDKPIQIYAENFELGINQKSNLNNKLQQIIRLGPYNSKVTLSMELTNKGHAGYILVNSIGREFYSEAVQINMNLLIDKLIKDIELQLENWKKERFNNKITKAESLFI